MHFYYIPRCRFKGDIDKQKRLETHLLAHVAHCMTLALTYRINSTEQTTTLNDSGRNKRYTGHTPVLELSIARP